MIYKGFWLRRMASGRRAVGPLDRWTIRWCEAKSMHTEQQLASIEDSDFLLCEASQSLELPFPCKGRGVSSSTMQRHAND